MEKEDRIFIIGDKSIVGRVLVRCFLEGGFNNVFSESICEVDLLNQNAVSSFFRKKKLQYVFFTHPESGGIIANTKYPAEFIYTNLQIQNNIIHYSYKFGVKKLLFLGSSCVYPRDCLQPMKEKYLLSGELEKTSEAYSVAKIAGIKMCQYYSKQYGVKFISLVPATIYGPEDKFDLEKSHVIAALIRKFYEAKINNREEVVIWGTGGPRREFIYIDDLIAACIFLMNNYDSSEVINVGCGEDISIKELAVLTKDVMEFKGEIIFDQSKPDGTPRKLLDNSKVTALGWEAKISLQEGISRTYKWYTDYSNKELSK